MPAPFWWLSASASRPSPTGSWHVSKPGPRNSGKVLDTGLWRYTRHPNYFGDFCVWWGLYLIAASAGGWWTVFSPILMSVMLLKVSGVTLLEKDIGKRRPAYADYIARTNAFFPGPRKSAVTQATAAAKTVNPK